MSLKKWLNRHNLISSAVVIGLLVAGLYRAAPWLYENAHIRLHFPYYPLEQKTMDWVANFGGRPAEKDPRLVFLADDAMSHTLDQLWDDEIEASPALKLMKRQAWSRAVFGHILNRLADAGASVVAFDYMFKGEGDGDEAFKEAVNQHADVVVLGSHIDDARVSGQRMPAIAPPAKTILGESDDLRVGFINIFPDPDGIVRHMRYHVTLEEVSGRKPPDGATVYEAFSGRMARQAGATVNIPSDRNEHRFRYAYKGETLTEAQRPISLYSIFVPSIWEANYQNGEFFRDKIVLVGPEGNYTKDVAETPFGLIAGPELHLNAVNAILKNEFLREAGNRTAYLLIAGGALIGWLLTRSISNSLLRLVLLPILGIGAYLGLVQAFNQGWVVPLFSPLLALVGTVITATTWQEIVERLERARLRKTFERYVSRDVVKELIDNPQSYLNTIGGARKNVTVLFSDVRGFTTITESGDEQMIVKQLNEYFGGMVGIVFDEKGTLDKFIGDAVMAQWGGIYTEGEKADACHAVRTAVLMRKKLAEMNVDWAARGMIDLKFGIGVNHGKAIVGNLGCEEKMEVSLIGDAVNVASRLEGMTKQYHVDFLIGETVEAHVRDEFIIRTVAKSQPKGTTKPLEIFTVLDERSPGTQVPDWLATHEEGVRLYRAQQFSAAIEQFEKVRAQVPDDALAMDYLEKCRTFLLTPPPADWNGVDILTSK